MSTMDTNVGGRQDPPLDSFVSILKDIQVDRPWEIIKVKIEKANDEEEKMSFKPKGDINLIQYLFKHELNGFARMQGWKLHLKSVSDLGSLAHLVIGDDYSLEKCSNKIRLWITEVLPNLHKEHYDISAREVISRLPTVLSHLLTIVRDTKHRADILLDDNNHCLVIVGYKENVAQIFKEAKSRLCMVTVEQDLESPSHGLVLVKFGFIEKVRGQQPEVTLNLQDYQTKVTWTGTELEIEKWKTEMKTFLNELKTETFKISELVEKLVSKSETKSHINNLLTTDDITCVWELEKGRKIKVWSSKASLLMRAINKVKDNFREDCLLLKDYPFVSKFTPRDLHLSQVESHLYVTEQTPDKFCVAATTDVMQKILQHIWELEDDNEEELKEEVKVQPKNIVLADSGNLQSVAAYKNLPNGSLQKAQKEVNEAQVAVDVNNPSDFNHIDSGDDFEHIPQLSIEMSEEQYQALLFFCGKDNWVTKAQSVSFNNGMLRIGRLKGNCRTVIDIVESKMKYFDKMNKNDVSFTPEERPKVQKTIDDINSSLDEVFCYRLKKDEDHMIHIMALNYGQIQMAKHKINLGLGRIKQTETRQNRRVMESSSLTLSSSSTDFRTNEGLAVKVYTGSILHLDVDCIVNTANENLQHGGGVARVIADAAGYKFGKESRDYIYNQGPLRVGQVCTTSAGNLKYKGVIHAVGPRWYDYGQNQKQHCLLDLERAVISCLVEADRQRFRSIAIPPVSSGIFDVPKDLCAQQYYLAVKEYSVNRGPDCTLTEVHFIDKDTYMCQLIQITFTKCFGEDTNSVAQFSRNKGTPGNLLSMSVREPSKRQAAEDFQRNRSHSYDESSMSKSHKGGPVVQYIGPLNCRNRTIPSFVYRIGDKLTVALVQDNIVKAKTDAIVSPENILCDSRGRIAREIAEVAGKQYVENDQSTLRHRPTKPKMTEVLDTLAGETKWKYVLHVVAPRWDRTDVKENQQYEKDLAKSYGNILYRMDKLKLKSIALPILGTGSPGFTTPYNAIAKVILCVSKEYTQRISSEKRLLFYCNDSALLKPIVDVFDQECQSSADQVPEDCCICMDKVTNPKRLTCGHTFCTDCIETQFKYKPACPSCGAVHGKIIGDQPPGTISIYTTKSHRGRGGSLPGYEGCGIITVTYNFPSGKQGPDHPTPGKHYQGIARSGYLPDNDKGRLVAKLLKIAFDRKLVFTIGRSRTTGHDGVVTWNDISHKTRQDGGPQAFGYPDPTYLDRVLEELRVKGVTEESLIDP